MLVSFEAPKYSTLHLFSIQADRSTASSVQENKKERGIEVPSFLAMVKNIYVGIARKLMICMVPRAPSSTERREIASLLCSPTMLIKSYGLSTAYWEMTFAPKCMNIDFF